MIRCMERLKTGKKLFQRHNTYLKKYLRRKTSTNFRSHVPGTMPLNSPLTSNHSTAKPTTCHHKNNRNWKGLLKNICAPAVSDLQYLLWHHPSFSSKRKMENYAQRKTIANSTRLQSKIVTHCLSLASWLIILVVQRFSPRWISDEDTTIFVLRKEMNGKLHLGPMLASVMFFGLMNLPATFQNFMNHIFKDLIHQGVVSVYMDDILVHTTTHSQHQQIVKEVLWILRDNDLFLKPEKCIFHADEVEYLGMIVGKGQIRMDPAKITAIRDWPTPTNKQ